MAGLNVRTAVIAALIVAGVLAAAWYVAARPMDFRVYYYGAQGVFAGSRPVYGPSSGLGWPMHYRYPPLFLLLFAPFSWLPLGLSAALWLILKALVLIVLVRTINSTLPAQDGVAVWLVPLLLAGPYVVEDFRYGNAQFLVFALTAFSLLLSAKRPPAAGAALALGVAVKVWPLFFVPYLLLRREWKTVQWAAIILVILTLLPSFYFGFGRNVNLLAEWFNQEFRIQTGQDEVWFPSQSLRGVLMRYMTAVDYSQVPDSNYPAVNAANFPPRTVRIVWFSTASVIYAGFLALVHSRQKREAWIEAGLAFCLLALLEPFTQKYALVIVLWPAIAAGRLFARTPSLICLSIGLALIQPIVPGAQAQRFMQALGFDFAAMVVLAVALAWSLRAEPRVITTFSPLRHTSLTEQ
jgi:Glycosyltransferase family 87